MLQEWIGYTYWDKWVICGGGGCQVRDAEGSGDNFKDPGEKPGGQISVGVFRTVPSPSQDSLEGMKHSFSFIEMKIETQREFVQGNRTLWTDQE